MAFTMPVRRTPTYTILSGGTHVHTFDSSVAVGDVMIATIEQVTSATVPAPAGWTQRYSVTHNTRVLLVFTKVREAGETSVTISRATSGAGKLSVAALGSAKTDPATWIFGTGKNRGTSPVDTNLQTTALSITTSQANTMVVAIFGEATTTGETATPPTISGATFWHFTPQTSTNEIETVLLGYKEMATAGATGTAVATYQNPQASNGAALLIGFPGVETTTPTIPKLAGKVVDETGAIVNVGLTATAAASDGSGSVVEVGLAKLDYVHGGLTVQDLSTISRVWTMGHRGGSIDYQEHSERGYFECAINHIDVMEFSVGISSDGVLFGLHDDTLNRTSSSLGPTAANGGTDVKPTDLTWAQISQLVQDLPNRGDTRFTTAPYLKLDDFVDRWAATHTLAFDPKLLNTTQRRTILMPRLQQIPSYRSHVIGKYYTTGTAIADEFHGIGCPVWGYSYTADVGALEPLSSSPDGTEAGRRFIVRTDSQSTSATASKWDYLGLEYAADARAWAAIKTIAGSKRVLGHIVGTVANADSAVAKGANALQVAGVRAVMAKY